MQKVLPNGWETRVQMGITLPGSEPEPDLAIVREQQAGYMTQHPGPADVGLVVEVSDSSLDTDRRDKGPIYAHARLPEYWVINIPDRQVEVYSQPPGPMGLPAYGVQQIYKAGQSFPFMLNGIMVATVAVDELMP